MSINDSLITDYAQTLDVCSKRIDLYHVSLQFFLKLGFSKIAVCIPDATLDGKLVVRLSYGIPGASNKILKAAKLGQVAALEAYRKNKQIHVEHFPSQDKYVRTDLELHADIEAAIYLPLTSSRSSKLEGLLIAGNGQRTDFPEELIQTAESMAQTFADHLSQHPVKLVHRQEELEQGSTMISMTDLSAALQKCVNTQDLHELSDVTMSQCLQFTQSEYGFVGYIDPNTGFLVAPTLTKEIFPLSEVEGKTQTFEKPGGLGGLALDTNQVVVANDPMNHPSSVGTPPGHLPIRRFLGVPCMLHDEKIGMIALANKQTDYTEADVQCVKTFASLYATSVANLLARQNLQETKDKYLNLYNNAPVCYFTMETDGTISDINDSGRALFGVSSKQKIDFNSYLSEPDKALLNRWLVSYECSGASLELSLNARERQIPVLFSARPHCDEHEYVQHYHCSLVDITDRKQAEIELKEKNDQLQISQQIIASVSELLSFVDNDYIYQSVNAAYCRYHGTTYQNIIGRSVAEVNGEEAFQTIIKPEIDRALNGEKIAYEAWFEYAEVGRRYVMVEYTPCHDNQGKFLGVVVLVKDITERKLAEETLSRTEELQRTLLNSTPDIICFKDGHGHWLLANQADLELFQLTGVDYQGKTDVELAPYSPFYAKAFMTCKATDEKAWESRKISIVEEVIATPEDGNQIYEVIKHPLFYPDGSRKALVVIGRKITERKKIEQKLQANEAKFRTLLDRLEHIPIQGYDEERRVVYWNAASTAVYGYSHEEALGRKLEELIIPSHMREEVVKSVQNWLDGGEPIPSGELTLCDKEGNDVPVFSSHVMHVLTTGQQEMFCIDIDLRMLHSAEEQLRRLAAAVEQTGETIVITDPDANIVYVNPDFTEVTGYTREEALGQNPRILQSGEVDESVYSEMWQTLLDKQTWKGRLFNKKKNGDSFIEDVNITPILNSAGDIVNYVAAKRDITDQLSIEEQYRQSQKLEAVGQLAGGVAHDFNNMLAIIIGQTEIALRKIQAEDPLTQRLQNIKKAAQRSSNLTQQLLGFARKQPSQPRVLNINEIISGTLKMLQRLVGENINLGWQSATENIPVKIDPSHLDQVLTNLVINARDAIKNTGFISVSTSYKVIDETFCKKNPGLNPGDYVQLTVRDNGCGMTPEVLNKIFDPFFTTKQSGQGTGLGLAMVFGLVKQNKGYITVNSVSNEGTTFNLYFPVEHTVESKLLDNHEREMIPGTETILIVEDEADLLDISTSILQEAGYTVLFSQDPAKAVEIAKEYKGTIHLLLSDMVMPNMTSLELHNALQKIRPGIKTLYMSGYPKETHSQPQQQFVNEQLLMKPFSIYKLTKKVREVLDS
ncbi:MAG: PAS domain S-box protein [Desulfuromonadales bacterium]|nr:PAS domain S-box protein [Desulfuromonadales bacterium]MBN2793669.1 PAS domain S-box protein [Desulfuromonadales bacterium]